MRKSCLLAIVGLIIGTWSLAARGEWPIPQNAAKIEENRRKALEWNQKAVAEAYEKVGKKDVRWDGLVRDLMKVAVPYLSQSEYVSSENEVFQAAKKAIDAGCNDPIVLYIYARSSEAGNNPGFVEHYRRFDTAAIALASSQYSPYYKANARRRAGEFKTYYREQSTRDDARNCFQTVLNLLPESVKVDGLSHLTRRLWKKELSKLMGNLSKLDGDLRTAFDRIDGVLAKIPEVRPIRLALRGEFYIDYGWEARTASTAPNVTEEGWRKFSERIDEARKMLEESWKLSPGDSYAATHMITVEMATGHGDRGEMEKWFERAMDADGDDFDACWRKLLWLEPKWHGSLQEMISFSRACRESKNWRSGIALMPAEVYHRLGEQFPTTTQVKFYKQDELWKDVRGLFEECLKAEPENHIARSEYAAFGYLCSRFEEAHAQFEKLGPNLTTGPIFSDYKWLKQARAATADRVHGEHKTGAPPPKGFAVLAVAYGAEDRWGDETERAKLSVAGEHLKFSTGGLQDSYPFRRKALMIAYSLNGKVGLSLSGEGAEVELPPKDVDPAKLAEVPPRGFAVLAASYGDDATWVDVTEVLRKKVVDGKVEVTMDDLPDPLFGVHKALVIVYSLEGRIFVSRTRDDQGARIPDASALGNP
ncbi:hypothetical protein [Singulisphaera sp. PoT]|uniref:hypothetical protein n=1 Tax=Singulisphaera sp. PoT TaxID=3411797 RepID=UPI003BF49B36